MKLPFAGRLLAVAVLAAASAALQNRQIGQSVRNDGPQSHLSKSGTPTMGGALILSRRRFR